MKTPTRSERYRRQTELALARMLARRTRTTSAHRLAARILLGGMVDGGVR